MHRPLPSPTLSQVPSDDAVGGLKYKQGLLEASVSGQCFPTWGMSGKFLAGAKHMSPCVQSDGLKIELSIRHPNYPSDTVQKLPSRRRPFL